jgi:hypothetical protein
MEVKVEICIAMIMQSVMRDSELHIDAETNAQYNITYMSKCGRAKDNNSNESDENKVYLAILHTSERVLD